MKKLLVMLICVALSLSLMACDFIPLDDALDFVEDLFKGGSSSESLLYEFDDSSKTFTVTGIGTYTDAHVVIPDTHNGYPVVAIGERAFAGCSSLTSVTIPDSVTTIGNSVFSCCSSLTSVTIPDSVTAIGDYAFEYCSSLTSMTIPDSVTAIGDDAFSYCSSLTIVIFEDPTGWWYADSADATSGTAISESKLTNVSTAASYLRNHYCYKYWFKD